MSENKNEDTFFIGWLKIIFKAVQSGFFGFAIFFTVLLLSKYLSSLIGNSENFTVDLSDVLLSLIGFVLTFLISLLSNFSPKSKTTEVGEPKFKGRLHQ